MREISARMQSLGLMALVLAVFAPALGAPLNPLDDRAIVQWLYNLQGFPFHDIFGRTTDYYYRPVLLLTYLTDLYLWGAETSFMHLENLLLHAANTVLVFACARKSIAVWFPEHRWLPLVAALLFALHPVNTEAVNWIAARSDLLAGTFVLLATWLLLQAINQRRPLFAWFSLLPLVLGVLSKETAIFFLPAALALVFCATRICPEQKLGGLDRKDYLFLLSPYLFIPMLYLGVRGPGLLSHDSGMGLLRGFIVLDGLSSLQAALAGLGFYARKLLWPWPLNFAIDRVPEDYFWCGLLVVATLIWAVWRRGPVAGMLLACAFFVASALLALLLRPAWTPVAERYLYIPSAFFAMAVVPPGARLYTRFLRKRGGGVMLVLGLALITATTVSRNFIWQDNIRLFEDAVGKSPDFPFAKATLADLLREAGREAEGVALIQTNTAPANLRNADYLDLQRAKLLLEQGQPVAARDMILAKRRRDGQLYYKFQELLVKVDSVLLNDHQANNWPEILGELTSLYNELYAVSRDPFYLYRLGRLYLQIGDRVNAAYCLRQAAVEAPTGAHYKEAAQNLANRLNSP